MEDILVPLAAMATGVILFLPIIRAAVRIIEKKVLGHPSPDELASLREDLRMLHDRLDGLELGGERIAELEERVDFAERMLAQHREGPRLPESR